MIYFVFMTDIAGRSSKTRIAGKNEAQEGVIEIGGRHKGVGRVPL